MKHLLFILLFCFPLLASQKESMCADLQYLKRVLEIKYAPLHLKKSTLGWDLNTAFEKAVNEIQAADQITMKDFHQIVRRFLNSMCDFHVLAQFSSTESAFLPFSVKRVEGRYFIDTIDDEALSDGDFDIRIGDELIKFDGRPIDEVIEELRVAQGFDKDSPTAQRLVALTLTDRSGRRGDVVPRGGVRMTLKSVKTDALIEYQLMWDYEDEKINNSKSFNLIKELKPRKKKGNPNSYFNMLTPLQALYAYPLRDRSGGLGSDDSFVPVLGNKIWEGNSQFDSYIYEKDGKKIGYIRIPHFSGKSHDVQDFGSIVKYLEDNTEGLVLDLVHNPGGAVIYSFALASTLTDRPLITPRQSLCLTQKDALKAYEDFTALGEVKSNQQACDLFPDDPYMTYEYALFLKEFYRFVVREWNAGRAFTRPTFIGGVDHINPHPKYRYTKPILILIDEMDFSCADFFPAIMQDNKRATLFGARTAGAGGCVARTEFVNDSGIVQFSYTFSLAERVDAQLIENSGVKPDIEYQLIVDDIKYGYQGYSIAVNNAILQLIKAPK